MSQSEMMFEDDKPSPEPVDLDKSLTLDLAEILYLAREAQSSLNPMIILLQIKKKINKILENNK